MNNYSEKAPDWEAMRLKIIGLGESSIRKSYYPELQERLIELETSNANLKEVIEELQCKEEELNHNLEELKQVQDALAMARNKLSIINTLTFQDIQNSLFSLHGYLTLINETLSDEKNSDFMEKSLYQVKKIGKSLQITKHYQDMGIHPPKWHKLMEIFVFAISHLDLSKFKRNIYIENLFIYADPLFEEVLYYIMENIQDHSINATEYSLYFEKNKSGITLFIEDNGIGIEDSMKEKIFNREYHSMNGMGLFFVREILSITGIKICESGIFKKGARFELIIPEGRYLISDGDNPIIN